MRKIIRLLLCTFMSMALCTTVAMAAPPGSSNTSQRALAMRGGNNGYGRVEVTTRDTLRNGLKAPVSKDSLRQDVSKAQPVTQGGSATKQSTSTTQDMSPNGRNLSVSSKTGGTGKQVTIQNIPKAQQNPDNVLKLPDNGDSLTELIPAPQGEAVIADSDGYFDEDTVEYIKDNTMSVMRYPYVHIYGNVPESDYNDFTQYMDRLLIEHSGLVSKAVDKGWTVILTSYDLDDLLFNGTTSGVEGCTCFPKNESSGGTIFIHAGPCSYCILHEFGHALDYMSSLASDTDTFGAIYGVEGENLTRYGDSCALEFFAEIFMYEMLQPETTKAACPNACRYVNGFIDKFDDLSS